MKLEDMPSGTGFYRFTVSFRAFAVDSYSLRDVIIRPKRLTVFLGFGVLSYFLSKGIC